MRVKQCPSSPAVWGVFVGSGSIPHRSKSTFPDIVRLFSVEFLVFAVVKSNCKRDTPAQPRGKDCRKMKTNHLRNKCNQNVVPSNIKNEASSLFRQLDVTQQKEYLAALQDRVNKRSLAPAPQETA